MSNSFLIWRRAMIFNRVHYTELYFLIKNFLTGHSIQVVNGVASVTESIRVSVKVAFLSYFF